MSYVADWQSDLGITADDKFGPKTLAASRHMLSRVKELEAEVSDLTVSKGITLYNLASRYIGVTERAGDSHNHLIQWWHSLCGLGQEQPDEVPWCSSFVNGICWELQLPRSKSAAARSWLSVGTPIRIDEAHAGYDVVVFNRGGSNDPNVQGPGHVALFSALGGDKVYCLGGNQGDKVSVAPYDRARLLGVRRLL